MKTEPNSRYRQDACVSRRYLSDENRSDENMKALFITIGLIFMLGGIKDVNDQRPSLVTMGGTHVTPGYNPPMSSQETSPTHYMGYFAIGIGALIVISGIMPKLCGD